MTDSINLYELFGLKSTCTKDDIRKAYHKLILKYHPDKSNGDDDLYDLITKAYSILSDNRKRAEYDKSYKNKDRDDNFEDYKNASSEFYKSQKTQLSDGEMKTQKQQFNDEIEKLNKKHKFHPNKLNDKLDSARF